MSQILKRAASYICKIKGKINIRCYCHALKNRKRIEVGARAEQWVIFNEVAFHVDNLIIDEIVDVQQIRIIFKSVH